MPPLTPRRCCRVQAGGRAAQGYGAGPSSQSVTVAGRTTSTGEKCLVNVHAKSRLAWSLCRPRGQPARARPGGLPFPRGAARPMTP